MTTLELIAPIWVRLTQTPFNASDLADKLLHDGGLDISDFTKEDLICLMEDRFQGEWSKVVFSFSELLAYYANSELTNVQAVAWCFSVLIIGKASRNLVTDWGNHAYLLSICFNRTKRILTYDEFAIVLTQALSPYDNVDNEGRPDIVY